MVWSVERDLLREKFVEERKLAMSRSSLLSAGTKTKKIDLANRGEEFLNSVDQLLAVLGEAYINRKLGDNFCQNLGIAARDAIRTSLRVNCDTFSVHVYALNELVKSESCIPSVFYSAKDLAQIALSLVVMMLGFLLTLQALVVGELVIVIPGFFLGFMGGMMLGDGLDDLLANARFIAGTQLAEINSFVACLVDQPLLVQPLYMKSPDAPYSPYSQQFLGSFYNHHHTVPSAPSEDDVYSLFGLT